MASKPQQRKQSSQRRRGDAARKDGGGSAESVYFKRTPLSSGRPSSHNPGIVLLAAVSLIAFTAWLWSPALHFGFIYDDHLQIESNLWIQSWSHIGSLLREPLWSQSGPEHASPYYRPIFSLLLLIQYTLFGPNPEPWHLVSIALEGIVTLSLFSFLLIQWGQWLPAFAGAIFFACSPSTAEVVDWVSASDEALYTLLILLALCALALSARTAHPLRALLLRFCSAGFLVLAVLAKETAVIGVVLALAYEFLLVRESRRGQSPRGLWIFSIPLAVFLLTHHSLHAPEARSSVQALIVMLYAPVLALRKLLWPLPVSEFYDLWLNQPHSGVAIALHIGILLLAATALLWTALRSRFVAWALLVIILPIAAAIVGVWFFRDYDLFHDRYLYLPMAGLAMLIAAGMTRVTTRPRLLRPFVAILAIVLCAEAWLCRSVAQQFSSDMSLFSHAVHVAPRNILAWQLFADTELKMGDCRTAIGSYQQAEQLRADLWKTSFFLGVAYVRCGMAVPAAQSFTRAATVDGATAEQSALAWYEVGRAYITQGKLPAAETALHQAIVRDPGSVKIRNLLGYISSLRQGH